MIRALFLALLWVLLAGWDADYLAYGVVSVAAATALSHLLVPRSRLRLHVVGTARLVAWFLQQTGIGGGDVARRALSNLEHLVRTYPGSTFAVVTHRTVLKPLLAACLGMAEPSFWRTHVETASISRLRHTPRQGYCLTGLNDTHHLESFQSEWI